MPDITMCKGTNPDTGAVCPKRETCYRYTATPTEHWQSWFVKMPWGMGKKECEHYWEEGK